ncbi:MAG: hypothetical protein D3922_13425, partial [Candidatus Electrothrix sp. AR1]|nr:hypothetical protein [Candidatus Electrothrix sp. AR1]
PAATVSAAELVLYPGYITGSVTTGIDDYKATHISVSATGGGYSASRNVSGDSYSITVQAGEWDHAFNASATIRPEGESYPYTNVTFRQRTIAVAPEETVQNDYPVSGTVQFNVNITGDAHDYWYGDGYAVKNDTEDAERTHSVSRTKNYQSDISNASWLMPAVANEQVRIYARVYVRSTYGGVWYRFYWNSDEYLYQDIADGATVELNLNIAHVAPPQPPPPPPPPTYDYGAVEGNVSLDLLIDGKDYGSSFYRQYIEIRNGVWLSENPADYSLQNIRTGNYRARLATDFRDAPRLWWPYIEGDPANNLVTIEKDQTVNKDFSEAVGRLAGPVNFTGTLTNEDLQYYSLGCSGIPKIYDSVTNEWIVQPARGGSASMTCRTDSDPDCTLN